MIRWPGVQAFTDDADNLTPRQAQALPVTRASGMPKTTPTSIGLKILLSLNDCESTERTGRIR